GAGVFNSLVFLQIPFVIIMHGIVIISLPGVVVKNALVLNHDIVILRNRDNMRVIDALLDADYIQFRTDILNALQTTLGLVPFAIGFNFDFITLINDPVEFFAHLSQYFYWGGEMAAYWAPMAIAVINGLIFATFLTLILVPVMYYMVEEGRN